MRLATTSTSTTQCNYLFLDDVILLTRVLLTHWGRDEMAKGVIDTIRPKRDGQHFADDIFKCILLNENISISLRILQKYVLKVRIDSISALFQTMTWRQSDDKPLSETKPATLTCVTRPQWVKVFSIYIYINQGMRLHLWSGTTKANQSVWLMDNETKIDVTPTTLPPPVAPETSGAASDEKAANMTTFRPQWMLFSMGSL